MVMKRKLASGCAGVDNLLPCKDNNRMIVDDAKKLDEVLVGLKP